MQTPKSEVSQGGVLSFVYLGRAISLTSAVYTGFQRKWHPAMWMGHFVITSWNFMNFDHAK